MKHRIIAILSLFLVTSTTAADVQTLLQLVDYVGVDYPEAVDSGRVINEFEYVEMLEFAERIQIETNQLNQTSASEQLYTLSSKLLTSIDIRADAEVIAELTQSMRKLLMSEFNLILTPRTVPDLNRAQQIYSVQCSVCHGEMGRGDGLEAIGMEPLATNFHDFERARQRSLFGLYNTITLGVEGTSMPAWPSLNDNDRWSLAFFVGSLIDDSLMLENGEDGWQDNPLTLIEAVTESPAELEEIFDNGQAIGFWIRSQPERLFANQFEPLQVAKNLLESSLESYRKGDSITAQKLAITAYLEGFELIEAALSNVNFDLMSQTEEAMINYRQAITESLDLNELEKLYNNAIALLEESESALSGADLSPIVAFTGSMIILLREGLEAILVLAAIIAFLVKSDRKDALKYVHSGWIIALLAGIGTWFISAYVISISGATREITEGATALFAACILLYVGFWMHRNSNAKRWNQYLRSKMKTALTTRTLWTLAIISFLAVYREVFETILFYQALWGQVESGAHVFIIYGACVAIVALIILTWLMYKFGMRLPLDKFFGISAVIMVILAFIFTGKGIVALQEAGTLSSIPVAIPKIELLGIYPNVQSLSMQLLILILAFGIFFYDKFSHKPVD